MRLILAFAALLILSGCGGGSSGGGSSSTPPSSTPSDNLKLISTSVLDESIFWLGDFDDPGLYATIQVKNESADKTYLCYVRVSHVHKTYHVPVQALLPGETGNFQIPLQDFLHGYANSLFLRLEVDYNDYIDEDDETDNEFTQKILIKIPPVT